MLLEDLHVEKKLNIVFMGTPLFAVPVLEGLIEKYGVRAVVTQPDKLVGREQKLSIPPVKEVAKKHNILVLQPLKLKEEYEEILALEPELIITCAYGQMVPDVILNYPKYGCINVHASLLPKLRGGAPIHKAIIYGHHKTGITIMHMSSKMDAGDIITQSEVEITNTETASSLHDKLKIVGRDLLLETIPSIIDKTAPRIKQVESEVTFALAIRREEEKIDFNKTKREIYNQIRGLNSWPGAYFMFDNMIFKVWESEISNNYFPDLFNGQVSAVYEDGIGVKVYNGEIILKVIQPEGKRKMTAKEFINGYKEKLVGRIFL